MLRQAIRKLFATHPVETISASSGIVIVLIGFGLSTQSGWVWFYGQMLGLVGASLTSITIAWTFGHKASETKVAANLDVLARQLETSISQIHRSVRGGLDEPPLSPAYLAQIAQCIDNLIGVSRELGEITGRTAPPAIAEIIRERGDHAALPAPEPAAAQPEPAPSPHPEQGVIAKDFVTKALAEQFAGEAAPERGEATKSGDRIMVGATEPCPNCKAPVSFQIGNQPGDSAKPACEHCGQKFHAHRSSTGTLFLRLPGGTHHTRAVSVSCPVCSNRIPANIGEAQQESELRYCFSCGAKVGIDPATLDCQLIGKRERLEGRIDGTGALRCMRCGEPAVYLTANANGTFGICRTDDSLVVVAPAAGEQPPRINAA